MKKVVIYARYSSHGQTEQSIEGQLKVCYEYAKTHGYYVVKEYIDRALTCTSDRRPQFQQMIEDSKKELFQYVLVYQLDRFARDRYDSAVYKRILKKNGVKVLSAKENISADASGILVESVLEGMAEYYSAELSQKVKRGINLSVQKCKCIGGHRLFGYDTDKELNFIINEEEAKWVKIIHELYVSGMPVQDTIKKNYLEKKIIDKVKVLLNDEIIVRFAKKIKESLDNDNGQAMIKVYEKQLNQTKILISKYTDLLIEDRNIDLIMNKIDEL